MPATTLVQEGRDYGEFYVPRFEVTAQGRGLSSSVVDDIVKVTYHDKLDEIDSFELTLNNWDADTRTFKYVGAEAAGTLAEPPAADRSDDAEARRAKARQFKLFEPCARDFTLSLGYGARLTRMVTAVCTTLEPDFPAGGAPTLTVRALNVLHTLRRKQYRSHWTRKRDSDIATEIGAASDPQGGRRFPIDIKTDREARRKENPNDYVAQDNKYDIDFLMQRARLLGYVVYLDSENGKDVLYFGPSNARHPGQRDVTYELNWGTSLMSFKPTLSIANQVKQVEVRGWSRQLNRKIRAVADLHHPDITTNADLLPMLDRKDCKPREEVVVNEPMFTQEQADRRALGLLSDRLKQMVTATGSTIGLPDLRAGKRVKITGLGSRFSGTYFVTETTHTLDDTGYSTRFTARREDPGGGSA
jgi:uncharacterized protein